jgi:hypothetical protein
MILAFHGLQDPAFADIGLTEQELLQWYFEERLAKPVVMDLASHATQAGFKDTSAFLRALLREYCYVAHKDTTHADLTAF